MDSSSEEDNVSGKSTSSIEDDEVIIIDEVNCNLSSDKNERAENVSHITLPAIQTLQSMKSWLQVIFRFFFFHEKFSYIFKCAELMIWARNLHF